MSRNNRAAGAEDQQHVKHVGLSAPIPVVTGIFAKAGVRIDLTSLGQPVGNSMNFGRSGSRYSPRKLGKKSATIDARPCTYAKVRDFPVPGKETTVVGKEVRKVLSILPDS